MAEINCSTRHPTEWLMLWPKDLVDFDFLVDLFGLLKSLLAIMALKSRPLLNYLLLMFDLSL
jgi:hypothetical protein